VAVPEPAAFLLSFLPTNTAACIAALLTARLARWVYDTNYEVIRMTVQS
jgi:hypothetical protein